MKLAPASDPLGINPPPQSSRQNTDPAGSDGNSPPFDGVLADVGRSGKDASQSGSAASTATASTNASDATTAAASSGVAAISTPEDPTSVSPAAQRLMRLLAAGVPAGGTGPQAAQSILLGPSTSSAAGTSLASGDADATTVGDLLKRISTKKGDGTDDAPRASASTVTSNPTAADLAAALVLGATGTTAPQPAAASSTPSATAATPATPLPNAAATSASLQNVGRPSVSQDQNDPSAKAEDSTDASQTLVSNLSVETHLAPVGAQTSALIAPKPATAQTAPASASTTFAKAEAPQPTATLSSSAVAPVAAALADARSRGSDDGALSQNAQASATAIGAPAGLLPASLAPVRSIAAAIGQLAEAAPATPAQQVPDLPKPATLGVARTLTLQMTPPDLGTVGVRLHVTGQSLDVQLSFSNPETLGLVSRDRDSLAAALQDQNYQVNSLVIQDGGAAASSGGQNATGQNGAFGGGANPDRQNASSGFGGQSGARQGQEFSGSSQDKSPPPARSLVDSSGGSLFV